MACDAPCIGAASACNAAYLPRCAGRGTLSTLCTPLCFFCGCAGPRRPAGGWPRVGQEPGIWERGGKEQLTAAGRGLLLLGRWLPPGTLLQSPPHPPSDASSIAQNASVPKNACRPCARACVCGVPPSRAGNPGPAGRLALCGLCRAERRGGGHVVYGPAPPSDLAGERGAALARAARTGWAQGGAGWAARAGAHGERIGMGALVSRPCSALAHPTVPMHNVPTSLVKALTTYASSSGAGLRSDSTFRYSTCALSLARRILHGAGAPLRS